MLAGALTRLLLLAVISIALPIVEGHRPRHWRSAIGRSALQASAGAETDRSGDRAVEDVISLNILTILPDMSKPQEANWTFSLQKVRPAIELALTKIHDEHILATEDYGDGSKDQTKATFVQFQLNYTNSGCNIATAINEAFNFYQQGRLNVILGPCCNFAAAPVVRQVILIRRRCAWI